MQSSGSRVVTLTAKTACSVDMHLAVRFDVERPRARHEVTEACLLRRHGSACDFARSLARDSADLIRRTAGPYRGELEQE